MTTAYIPEVIAVSAGLLLTLCLLPGTAEVALVSFAAMLPRRRFGERPGRRVRIAIVVPAHNEEAGIETCVRSLRQSADISGREAEVYVVADNCTDATASRALRAGAFLLARTDDKLRGKGYALAYAFRNLEPSRWDACLVVDADTVVSENLVRECALLLERGAEAVQARYLVRNPNDGPRTRLMNVALLAFNHIRPKGRDQLALSCGIYGNGFALSRTCIERIPYEAFSIVEDLEYHLRLVLAGGRVHYADQATVFGAMPEKGASTRSQRMRWEGGRAAAAQQYAGPLCRQILSGNAGCIEPLLDLLCLPLTYHTVLLFALTMLALGTGNGFLFAFAATAAGVLALHLALAVCAAPEPWRAIAGLAGLPVYLFWKLAVLPGTLRHAAAGTRWIRTERSN